MPVNAMFFAKLRTSLAYGGATQPPLFTTFSQQQVDALNTIATVFDAFTGHDHCIDDLAYIMATSYRECGSGLNLAIEEIGKGRNKPYGLPAGQYNKVYYGRGPCQSTWLANYQKAKLRSGIDFVQYPEYMLDPAKSVVDMIAAMYAGAFTGKSLRTYITVGKPSTLEIFTECRRIINGTDHAQEVAYVALAFQAALRAGYEVPAVVIKPVQPQGFWAKLASVFGRK